MEYAGKEWLHIARLTKVIDSGSHIGKNWFINKKVFLQFQLHDYTCYPKDASLPPYKQFTKYGYGWLMDCGYFEKNNLIPLLKVMWWEKGDDILSFLVDNVGKMVYLNIENNIYKNKVSPILSIEGHQKYEWPDLGSRGVDASAFVLDEDTTKSDIDSLWFDNKWLKKSLEYEKLKSNVEVDEEQIETLFG